ncbi:MAG: T9SS type A sorting domain-containing protein, partial [Tannerella sp.]|nr:T9SS type A sorting domain-containing protein [Tannerella sp.]
EKGNLSYEITVFEGEGYREEFEAFYTNFYESVIDANEVILSFQSAVYPNPVSDVMNVTVEGADNALITLVNINGSIVFQQKTSRRVTPISVKSLTKGYYFLTVQAGKQMKTYKILIR